MLNKIKQRCGIAVGVYDEEIIDYIEDAKQDMVASGVPETLINDESISVITAVSLYVKALLGSDRSDTDKYMDLYRRKVFRLTLEGEDVE